MKLIAHRGASLERPENSLESLTLGAELGAYAVECDVRKIADGSYVIFHDGDLGRLAGVDRKINELSFSEADGYLRAAGRRLLTFDDICEGYHEKAYVLLHINCPVDDKFVGMLKKAPFGYICGVRSAEDVAKLTEFLPPERILGFIPEPGAAGEFIRLGAGNVRLWEQWLTKVTPADVKREHPEAEVWIMANRVPGGMNGCPEALDWFLELGADGVLLNDIVMGMKWLSSRNR